MSSDINSGPTVGAVFDELRARMPLITIERLVVKWPADDDNVWFIRLPGAGTPSVQIDTASGGLPPFLVEGDGPDQRRNTSEVHDTVDLIVEWLRIN